MISIILNLGAETLLERKIKMIALTENFQRTITNMAASLPSEQGSFMLTANLFDVLSRAI